MAERAPVTTTPYEPSRRAEWDAFCAASNNATVFHNLDFLDYHPQGRFEWRHLMFFCGDTLVAILPGAVFGSVYRSPAGASFGGFVCAAGLELEIADSIVKAFVEWCRAQNITEIAITPPLPVYQRTIDQVIDYALIYNGFTPGSALYSSVIDLSRIRGKNDLSRNTRHRINQSLNKGVRIEQSTDLDTFYPILLENKAKFGVKPTHTLEELKRIESLVPGMMTLFLAYYEQEAIAGELLFAANDRCMLNFYTMHLYKYHNFHAVNCIVEHALGWCVERGYLWYDYGVSADTFSDNPLEPSWSLVRFKESMGSTGCVRLTYRKVIG